MTICLKYSKRRWSEIKKIEKLKQLKGISIYAQAERNERKGIIPDERQLEFSQRYIYGGKYRSETWQEYCRKHKIKIRKRLFRNFVPLPNF